MNGQEATHPQGDNPQEILSQKSHLQASAHQQNHAEAGNSADNFEKKPFEEIRFLDNKTQADHSKKNSHQIPKPQANNPLHGLTLEKILTDLVEAHGWERLSRMIEIRCFYSDPSIPSSLKFLRRTPWARTKVEALYLKTFH